MLRGGGAEAYSVRVRYLVCVGWCWHRCVFQGFGFLTAPPPPLSCPSRPPAPSSPEPACAPHTRTHHPLVLQLIAAARGKLKRGGTPNMMAAARIVLMVRGGGGRGGRGG